jgi:TolB-like protein
MSRSRTYARILDQNREHGSCIQTIPGGGYCFAGTVREAETHVTIAPTAVVSPRREPTPLALRDRPSIAVLRFANMTSDAEQEYFTDGITEDIITAMSRYPPLFVIPRSSCFTYKWACHRRETDRARARGALRARRQPTQSRRSDPRYCAAHRS